MKDITSAQPLGGCLGHWGVDQTQAAQVAQTARHMIYFPASLAPCGLHKRAAMQPWIVPGSSLKNLKTRTLLTAVPHGDVSQDDY